MFGRDVFFGGSARFGITALIKQRASKRSRRERSRRTSVMGSTRLFPEFLEQRAMMAIDMPLVSVGDAGNAADRTTGYGAVAEAFQMGQYEVTLGQYAAFLNAVARTDPAGLYNPNMATDTWIAGIARSGSSGSYTYSTISDSTRPVTYVSWFDAARFANWMANGQPTGTQSAATTEDGAYKLNGAISGGAPARNTINPNTGAAPRFFIPSESQWYKAAYYSPKYYGLNGPAGYYKYANKSDGQPGNAPRTGGANYYTGVYAVTQSSALRTGQTYLTPVGSFRWNVGGNASFYGTYDQNGNVGEWNDLTGTASAARGIRGGSWRDFVSALSSSGRSTSDAAVENASTGFRLASPLPTLALNAVVGQLAENSSTSGGVRVGILTTSNTTVATPSFTISGPDAGSFELRGNSLFIKSGVALNFEAKTSYSVTVGLADPAVSSTSPVNVAYSLKVTDVNEAPTAITLLNVVSSLAENVSTASRIRVADIGVTDPDASLGTNALTVSGLDAASFEIVGRSLFLRAGVTLNAVSKPNYSFTVAVADPSIAGSSPVTANSSLLITRAVATVPGVPTNLAVTPAGSRAVGLRWSPPGLNGGSAITNYRIEYRTRTGSVWSAWQVWSRQASASTSVTLRGLSSSLIYGFRIRAENAIGAGAFTNPSADIKPAI